MPEKSELLERFPSLLRLALRPHKPRIPVVRQLASTDCGAAALAMVLGYHGKSVPLDEIRNALGPGRDGASATALIRTGRLYGLRGRGVRLEVDDIDQLPCGAILYWEFRHFVVLEGVRRKRVDIVDPGQGRTSVSMDRLRKAFTGVALVFEPTESFQPGGRRSKKLLGLFGQVLERRDLLARIISTSLFVQVLSAALPLLTGVLIDRVIPRKDYSLLLVITVGYCLFQIFNVLAGYVRSHLFIHLRVQLETRFSLRFLDHLVDLPYSFFQQHTSGDLMVRLGSNNTVRDILTAAAMSAFLDGTMAALYLALLVLASPQLTLAVGVLAACRFALLAIMRWRQRQFLAESLDVQSRAQTFEVEMLSGMETLKAMGLEHRAVENWTSLFVDNLNISIKLGRLDAIFNALLGLLGTVTSLCFMFYGAYLVLQGAFTLGTMMAFSALAGGFLGPLNNLVASALQLQMLEVYLERLNDVLETPREQEHKGLVLTTPLSGEVGLEGVSFRYGPQSRFVLEDVSLHVSPGARIALVGRSGSGKSTLARLMAGLYEPTAGRILFDGHDLRTLDRRSVRSQLGIVTQDTQLFGGSIRHNIAMADPHTGLERIIRAARLAQINDDIVAMPMGYETILTDRGFSLSGGQRQRLALARALAASHPILILDEATSDLDALTEEQVNRNLASLRCTRIVVAHRLSTIRDADLIVVLESGRIVERGRHEELVRAGGAYAGLVRAQSEPAAYSEQSV